jgi:hypothetical protein
MYLVFQFANDVVSALVAVAVAKETLGCKCDDRKVIGKGFEHRVVGHREEAHGRQERVPRPTQAQQPASVGESLVCLREPKEQSLKNHKW